MCDCSTYILLRLDRIDSTLNRIERNQRTMSKQIDDLTTEVAEVTTVEQSAITLITGIADQLAAANGDIAKIDALTAQLRSSASTLGAAVAANTPAAAPAP